MFDDISQVPSLVNGSDLGLSAAIQTASPARALELASQIHSGMIHINDVTVNHDAHAPFGGVGASGHGGRFGGDANFDEFTEWQWITLSDSATTFPF